jgi:hypothetical protein
VVPYVIVHDPKGVRVYAGFQFSKKGKSDSDRGVLQALTDWDQVQSIIDLFNAKAVDEGKIWQNQRLQVDPSRRVYHQLLKDLRELDKWLRGPGGLLQLGYESLTPTAFTNAEEDDITGELCKHMKLLTEEQPTERWMARYSIHDQDPVNDKANPETGKTRRGKCRPRLDVRLVSKARMPNTQFCTEAKRLYRSDSVQAYIDDEGLGAFVGEYYAERDDAAGMLGYVQCDLIADWLEKLRKKLSGDTSLQKDVSGEVWKLSVFGKGPKAIYLSIHYRKKSGRNIEVFHTFFLFC